MVRDLGVVILTLRFNFIPLLRVELVRLQSQLMIDWVVSIMMMV